MNGFALEQNRPNGSSYNKQAYKAHSTTQNQVFSPQEAYQRNNSGVKSLQV